MFFGAQYIRDQWHITFNLYPLWRKQVGQENRETFMPSPHLRKQLHQSLSFSSDGVPSGRGQVAVHSSFAAADDTV